MSFTSFSELPTEIRLKIWELALPPPQTIKVRVFAYDTAYDPEFISGPVDQEKLAQEMRLAGRNLKFSVNLALSGLFSACRESRAVILGSHNKTLPLLGENPKRMIRFNDGDTITFYHEARHLVPILPMVENEPTSHPDYREIFKYVKNVTMASFYWERSMLVRAWFLQQFPALENLTILNFTTFRDEKSWVRGDDTEWIMHDLYTFSSEFENLEDWKRVAACWERNLARHLVCCRQRQINKPESPFIQLHMKFVIPKSEDCIIYGGEATFRRRRVSNTATRFIRVEL